MVVYDLLCGQEHRFEGWFRDRDDFERQSREGLLCCPYCDSSSVRRIPSASYVSTGARETSREAQPDPLTLLRKLHQYVEQNFTDVGTSFYDEARKIHDGQAEQRNIRGTATPEQVADLHESGVSVLPLPPRPVPREKLN